MKLRGDVYLFVDDGEESKMAAELLKSKGVKFKVIDVKKDGIRGWMLFEFGTTKTPILASASIIVIGLSDIREFVKRYGEAGSSDRHP